MRGGWPHLPSTCVAEQGRLRLECLPVELDLCPIGLVLDDGQAKPATVELDRTIDVVDVYANLRSHVGSSSTSSRNARCSDSYAIVAGVLDRAKVAPEVLDFLARPIQF
jgi:hypothetical protein